MTRQTSCSVALPWLLKADSPPPLNVPLAASSLDDRAEIDDVTVLQWRRDQLVDDEGRLLDVTSRTIWRPVRFKLTKAELLLDKTVRQLVKLISTIHGPQDVMAETLLHSLQSSPDALGGTLQRLLDRLTGAIGPTESFTFADHTFSENEADISSDQSRANEPIVRLVREALDRIDQISVDSKFNVFWKLLHPLIQSHSRKLLRPLIRSHSRAQRVCILTDYLATLWYLAAAVESTGKPFVLHSSTTGEEVEKSLRSFAHNGGILLATRVVITQELGNQLAFGSTKNLVLYDFSTSNAALKETLAVFEPLGRQSQLSVHVLMHSR
jgi:hypothetical protein